VRYLTILIGIGMLGYLGYTQYYVPQMQKEQEAAAAPPPPPPAILQEEPPMVLDQDAIDRVRTSTRDTDPTVRLEALQFLIAARDPQADEIMFQMLHQDSEPQIRRQVVEMVGNRPGPDTFDHLVRRLQDTEPNVRLATVNALVKLGDPEASEYLGRLLHDSDEQVRLLAIKAVNDLQAQQNKKNAAAQVEHQRKMDAWKQEVARQKAEQAK
jgi:HEAT repeat protein